jgi:hypothetical protein
MTYLYDAASGPKNTTGNGSQGGGKGLGRKILLLPAAVASKRAQKNYWKARAGRLATDGFSSPDSHHGSKAAPDAAFHGLNYLAHIPTDIFAKVNGP